MRTKKIISVSTSFNAQVNENVSRYMAEITQLAQEVDRAVYVRAAAGEQAAINMAVESNLKLVLGVVKNFNKRSFNLDIDDLIQEGNIGLIVAVKKYDVNKAEFSTLAALTIRQYIIEGIRKYGHLVRLPKHLIGCTNYFENSGDKIISVSADGKVTTAFDLFEGSETADSGVTYQDTADTIKTILESIERPRDREIVIKLFGLDGEPELSIKELAAIYGVSAEAIRQVKIKSLEIMKSAGRRMKERGLL